MGGNRNHHLCVHGHFYQPPRENPWLEMLEPQPSAAPFRDWNTRIAAESYAPLTHSRCRDETGAIHDLFNNFAHLSFNIGPTLQKWLDRHDEDTARQIVIGEAYGRDHRNGHGGALAQAYNHLILPLCSAHDRHTQIVWGQADFRHRYGRAPEGMWLPECAIDMNTIRALIDHQVRFVILSPEQASFCRPLGESEWHNVSTGNIDTRHPYRVYEVDGAGVTHFDRHLDIFFYDPGVSLKVSFEQLPNDHERFITEVENSFADDATLPQITLVATDGEAYGHHVPGGQEGLARLFSTLLDSQSVLLSTLSQYLWENPPSWEVKLWMGEDGRGSSWSCKHGVGRWHTDCGCAIGGNAGWTQSWRAPLRKTLDLLRSHIDAVFVSEGRGIFRDPWVARDDYIQVLLNNTPESRAEFLARHCPEAEYRPTSDLEEIAWTLLEASRNAMFMYTSCGWFFDDISGLEPVQNLRYALRAAELIQPWCEEVDLTELLRDELAAATSNEYGIANGREVFDREVFTARCGTETIAAVQALLKLLDAPPAEYVYSSAWLRPPTIHAEMLTGVVRVVDTRTTVGEDFSVLAYHDPEDNFSGVLLLSGANAETLGNWSDLAPEQLRSLIEAEGLQPRDLPQVDRQVILTLLGEKAAAVRAEKLANLCAQEQAYIVECARASVTLPRIWQTLAEDALEKRFLDLLADLQAEGRASVASREIAQAIIAEATATNLQLARAEAMRRLSEIVLAGLLRLPRTLTAAGLTNLLSLFSFARETATPLTSQQADQPFWTEETAVLASRLEAAYWRLIKGDWATRLSACAEAQTAEGRGNICHLTAEVGRQLGFSARVVGGLC